MNIVDDFQKSFEALTAHKPMTWQSRLFKEYLVLGRLPTSIDIPTGLGKTAVMAIWLIALARQFGQGSARPKLPRRLFYVVDRRAVVDQATDFATSLREKLDSCIELRAALGLAENKKLPISTLRGKFADNREWLDHPCTPAIVVGTVDMIGSRLLFEGYGVSRKMRPYHAGLLGVDALVVLDESHLVPPFEKLLAAIAARKCDFGPREDLKKWIPPFRLLPLSATGRLQDETNDTFGLKDEDSHDPVINKRLHAPKHLFIRQNENADSQSFDSSAIDQLSASTPDAEDPMVMAREAWQLTDGGSKSERVIVFCDKREIAVKAKEAIEKIANGDNKSQISKVEIYIELFVGGRRVFERETAKKRLETLGFIEDKTEDKTINKGPTFRKPTRPTFLIATSAAEVGVDLEADHLVCDLVAWERMVQRLGRVNRRGDGEAKVIVIELNAKERELIKTAELRKAVRQLIERLPRNDDGTYDASPSALSSLKTSAAADENLHKMVDEASTPEPLRPALTRPLVEAWAMTSLEKHTGRPAIQPWIRGWIEDDPPQTAIIWRTHLPVRTTGPAPSRKEIEEFFEAAPVHLSEILEIETFRAVKWLAERAKHVRKPQGVKKMATEEPDLCEENFVAFALDADGKLRKAFRLAELDINKKEKPDKLLAGATLVLDARLGGLKDGLLNDKEAELPRTADDGLEWMGEGTVGFRVQTINGTISRAHDQNWHERFCFASAVTEDGEATRWLIIEKWHNDAATEEDRSASNPQLLDEHQSWTEKRARRLAQALGLEDALMEALALAARFHDEGKRAARWQRAFHAPSDGIYAKTEGPIDYTLLDGYRHELGSLLRIEQDERIRKLPDDHRDLVLHLIAAHHGFARPVIGTHGCEDAPPSALNGKAAEIALRFARLQDQWGPWGLAWWEALLRAADQQASRDNDARIVSGGDT